MAYFRVLLHGTGIRLPRGSGDGYLIGFYTTRAVHAASIHEAIDRAKAQILTEWSDGGYRELNAGEHPNLAVESVYSEDFSGYLTFRNTGYSFYTDGNEDHA